jgi:hypothetical protein
MKSLLILCSIVFLINTSLLAQNKIPPVDQSPLDISYYPENYPASKAQKKTIEPLIARVIYSRPGMNGRKVFGALIEYGKVWRLGANEATEIEFFVPVKIAGKLVPKGRYTLYGIPSENSWTLILNTDNFSWGNFSYNAKKDLLRTEVPVIKTLDSTDAFTLYFEENNLGAGLIIMWDQVKVMLPISLSKETVNNKKK